MNYIDNVYKKLIIGVILLVICFLITLSTSFIPFKKEEIIEDDETIIESPFDESYYEELKNVLNGKSISILGDDISTYSGWSDNISHNSSIVNNKVYYDGTNESISTVNDTWWMQTISCSGLELLVNNSSSGDCATVNAINRVRELHNNDGNEPDIIAIYIGLNDLYQNKSADEFRTAYEEMLSEMTRKYVGKDVYLFTLLAFNSAHNELYSDRFVLFNEIVKELAVKYGCTLVDLYSEVICSYFDILDYLSNDGIYPNDLAMDIISKCFADSLMENYITDISVKSLTYMGNVRYNLSDSDPELKLQVRYSNCVTEEINITEDMYVVDDTHSIPDFKKAGVYEIEILYKNSTLNFNIEVIDPDKCILIKNDEFLYGSYFDHDRVGHNNRIMSGEYAKIKSADALHPTQDITVKVRATDVSNYMVTLGYFDKDGNYTGRSDILKMNNGELSIKANAMQGPYFRVNVYIYTGRFTKVPDNTEILVYDNRYIPTNEFGNPDSIKHWNGKKITIIGDSISVVGYPGILQEMTGSYIQNLSVSGMLLTGGMTNTVKNVDKDADLVIVFGGTNDYWSKNVEIDGVDSSGCTTYRDALKYILDYLKTNNPSAEILYIFPPDQTYGGVSSDTDFGKGSLDDFRLSFIDFCNNNHVDYLDLSTTNYHHSLHTTDGMHPNAAGHILIAEAIYCAICF